LQRKEIRRALHGFLEKSQTKHLSPRRKKSSGWPSLFSVDSQRERGSEKTDLKKSEKKK